MKQITGKNLDLVLSQYAHENNIEQSEITYFILEEKPGFLGFGASVTVELFALKDVHEFVETYLNKFFNGLELDVTMNIEVKPNAVNVMMMAENNAIIIGRGGSSLAGLNLVLRNAVNSKFKRRFNIFVDINNYKTDRYKKLEAMALRIAKTVQRTKVDASLDPMPNDERRVIHKKLSNIPNVKTQSQGAGRNRHLKISYVQTQE